MGKCMESLREFLETLGEGTIAEEHHQNLLVCLSRCWDSLDGSSRAAMCSSKLYRMEEPEWRSPRLYFVVERHGGMKYGSSRAELQGWTVDLEEETAHHYRAGYRQVHPTAEPYTQKDAEDDAEAIVEAMVNETEHEVLTRKGPILVINPRDLEDLVDAAKQTVIARSKRLRRAVSKKVAAPGHQRFEETHHGGMLAFRDREFAINMNEADEELLQYLPYVGPKTAEQIVRGRPWRSIDQLAEIAGLTADRLEEIKDQGFATV